MNERLNTEDVIEDEDENDIGLRRYFQERIGSVDSIDG